MGTVTGPAAGQEIGSGSQQITGARAGWCPGLLGSGL